jgi:hypothetical protein
MTRPARLQESTSLSLQLLAEPANSYAVMREKTLVPFVRDDVHDWLPPPPSRFYSYCSR